ncbi:hypothetical protein O3M35_001612 [Rhynocoris fuscipes]|uniref:CTLH domain-containing protein n=1 Tax=Rhynocoris fuscipes TaxID=488301 RepID=A0AAW1CQM9_9HEMI
MPSARLTLREEDIVRLTLEFLHNRELHISQLSLERESGVINGNYSDDVFYLRQLILDGQWDDVLEFIQPLEALPAVYRRIFFSVPFEQKTLNVDVERLDRPSLDTSWTEHMLVTPIKPNTFPYSEMPFRRPRSAADIMTRSLLPALEGLPFGLQLQNHSQSAKNGKTMALSTGDILPGNPMKNTSTPISSALQQQQQQKNRERSSSPKRSVAPVSSNLPSTPSTPEHRGRDSPANSTPTTARSSRRDSLSEKGGSSSSTTVCADIICFKVI